MPEVTPLDSSDDGVSVWTVVAIVVGAVVLVSVPVWFVIQSLIDSEVLSGESSSPEATSANPGGCGQDWDGPHRLVGGLLLGHSVA